MANKKDMGNDNIDEERGRPPTAEEQFWIDATSKITPERLDKSLDRLDTHGKYLFSTVSIVGTLLTGFGIFSPLGATVLRSPLLLIPVGLACLSLGLAMMGITPMVEEVKLGQFTSVQDYYGHQIRRRGRFVVWGSVAFSLSLFTIAFVTPLSLKPKPFTPSISVRLIGTGEKTALTSKIEFQDLPPSATAETEIVGYENIKKTPRQTILFKEKTYADNAGKLTVSAELDQVQKYKWFAISSKVKAGTELLCEKTLELRR